MIVVPTRAWLGPLLPPKANSSQKVRCVDLPLLGHASMSLIGAILHTIGRLSRITGNKGDYYPLSVPDASLVFFNVKEPIASSQWLPLIHFPSFFIQRSTRLALASAAS